MSEGYVRGFARGIVGHRWLVLVISLALTAVAGWQASHIRLDNRTRIWVPANQRFVKTTRLIQQRFGIRNAVTVGIVPAHGTIFQPAVLKEIRHVQDGLAALPGAVHKDVLSIAATRVRAISGNADGMVVHRMMPHTPDTSVAMATLKRRIRMNPLCRTLLVSRDDRAAAIVAAFRLSKAHPSYWRLYQRIRAVVGPAHTAQYTTSIGGAPSWNGGVEHHMQTMPFFFGAAFLVIMVIQYLAFRSFQGAVLPMVTALLSTIWALGFMGAIGLPMDVLNSVTPILIMAIGTGHSTQILKRYYEEYDRPALVDLEIPPSERRDRAIEECLAHTGPVMLLAGLIAMLAFLSLTLANIAMIRHFGIMTAAGIGAVLILEMTFMPALRGVLPAPASQGKNRRGWLDRMFEAVAETLTHGGALGVVVSVGLVMLVVAAGMMRIHVNNTPEDYFSPNGHVRSQNRVINHRFAGTGSLFVQISGKHPGAIKDPRVLKAMLRLQGFLDRQPGVGKTQSIANFVAQINQAMHGGRPAYDRIPHSRNLVAQYLFLYGASGGPNDFDNLVDHRYQHAAIWVFARHDGTAYTTRLYDRTHLAIRRDFPPSVRVAVGGGLMEIKAINHAVIHEKLVNIVQMALVIFLLASLVFRSFTGGLYVVAPLFLIVLANFGVMGWLHLPLDMGTVTTASLAMGIGADYELYLLFRFREEWCKRRDIKQALQISLTTSGRAVIYVTTAIIGGYSVLFFAHFGFYSQLATMVVTTMVVSLVLAIVFLRAVVVLARPRFLFGDKTGERLRMTRSDPNWR